MVDAIAIFDGAKALFAQKNFPQAKLLLDRIQDDPSVGSDVQGYLGLIALAEHDMEGAQRHFQKGIDLDPRATQAHVYMGEFHFKQKNYPEARKEFEIVRELDPKHQAARQRLAQLDDIGHQREEYRGDVYDLLRSAGDDFSIAAIRMIDENKLSVHGLRLRAYRFEQIFWVTVLTLFVLVAACLCFVGYSNGVKVTDQYQASLIPIGSVAVADAAAPVGTSAPAQPAPPAVTEPQQPDPAVLAAYKRALAAAHSNYYYGFVVLLLGGGILAAFLYWIAQIKRTVVTIDRGYITLEKGVFTRSMDIEEIYRVDSFKVHQYFLNQSCNEGALILDFAGQRENIELRGLAPIDQLKKLANDLRSLHLQLRSTNIGKGVLN